MMLFDVVVDSSVISNILDSFSIDSLVINLIRLSLTRPVIANYLQLECILSFKALCVYMLVIIIPYNQYRC